LNLASAVPDPVSGSGSKILVIDDDRDYNEGICESLELDGYQTAAAYSAKNAQDLIKNFDADIALIDVHLGQDSGIDLIPDIRRIRPNIRCVIITGQADVDTAIQAVKKGAYDYLRKPTKMEDLLATLERCWDLQKLENDKFEAEGLLRQRNQDLETINQRLRTMVDTTRKIVGCSGLQRLAPQLLKEFARNMGAEGGSMYLVEESGLKLAHTLDPGHALDLIQFPLRQGSIIEQAFDTGAPILVQDIDSNCDFSESGWSGYKDGSLLVMPLPGASGKMLGIVTFHNKTIPPFTTQDKEIGTILGSFSYEAIRAARAAEQLRDTLERQRQYLEEQVNERTGALLVAKESAESANREKSRFLSSMSHEVRTPLNAIIGFTELMSQDVAGPLTGKQREYIQYVNESGNYLLELITDLLDVSKIDSGAIELELEPVSIDFLFDAAGTMIRDNVINGNLDLKIQADIKLTVNGDHRRCLQILLNLLTNALKYTQDGGTIEIGATQLDNSFVKILVKDSGIGLDKEDQSRIFDEFHQVDPKRDSALGGSGIGLSLTRRLVELHGGDLGVESIKGEGSSFWFTLPIYDTDAKLKPDADVAKSLASDLPGRYKVLVFEDSEVNIALVQGFFGDAHDVKIAKNGELGIDMARSYMPDIILMDTRMPIMDGIEATKILKADDSLKDIPIIGLSASADLETVQQCYDAGVDGHISKPIQFDELIATMKQLLKNDI
jgi:signal transduction histidine kinase/DNA-binding response OmpR family regulator